MKRIVRLAAAAVLGAAAGAAIAAAAGALRARGPGAYAAIPAETAARTLRDARDAVAAGETDRAEAIYRDLAAARPLDADARLLLGIHLQDLARDPFGAIAQYFDYLRLAPGSEKERLVRERIRACELEIARRFRSADAEAGPDLEAAAAAQQRNEELEAALAECAGSLAAAREELAGVTAERDRLKRDVASKQNQLEALKDAGSSTRPKAADLTEKFESGETAETTAGPDPVAIADHMTYEVKRGDTLWKIAQKAYGDGSRTAEIKAANPGLVGADGSVREGDILRIPR